MEIIYVYYNPNNDKFYYKNCVTNSKFYNFVGTKNSYGHIIVQKFIIINDVIYDLDCYERLQYEKENKKEIKKRKKRFRKLYFKNLIKKLINHIIDLLYTFKSRF